MSEPLAVAILLTKDRPEMTRRAIASYRAQTYANRQLFVYDSGAVRFPIDEFWADASIYFAHDPTPLTIGGLRNRAISCMSADIIITMDSDDVSHPLRFQEQVAHLQSSGADVVGFNEILFWRCEYGYLFGSTHQGRPVAPLEVTPGEAWLYKYARATCGASFCMWRRTWERKPFPDLPKGASTGEDWEFAKGLNLQNVSALESEWQTGHCDVHGSFEVQPEEGKRTCHCPTCQRMCPVGPPLPRLICSIHGANHGNYDIEASIAKGSREWTRAAHFDELCRERMRL